MLVLALAFALVFGETFAPKQTSTVPPGANLQLLNILLTHTEIQKKQQLTKTMNRKEMSPATREFYLNGPMKYEAKLYDFALNMFKARLSAEGIPLVDKT